MLEDDYMLDLETCYDVFHVFYDESNNYRKVTLSQDGFNIPSDNNFVLAGIVSKEAETSLVLRDLKRELGFMINDDEIKATHFFKGTFFDMLKSKRFNTLLHIVDDNNFGIHLWNLNILYWGIIDIAQSLLHALEKSPEYQVDIATIIHETAKADKHKFLNIMRRHNFPNITQRKEFVRELEEFVDQNTTSLQQFPFDIKEPLKVLKSIFQSYNKEKLVFIEDDEPKIWIDDFLSHYIFTVRLLPNSFHYFDREDTIEELLNTVEPLDNQKLDRVFFIDSKSELRIQISDVISGFLGKYFSFIDTTSICELQGIAQNLSKQQKENIAILRKLIQRADGMTKALSRRVENKYNIIKSDMFLSIP